MDPSGPFKESPSGYIFTLFSCPLQPMGSSTLSGRTYGVTVQNSGDDGSKACGSTVFNTDAMNCANAWQVFRKPLWCTPRVALWLDFTSDRSVASSSVHFLYKYQYLSFSFLHFQLKHTVRAQPSSLVRDHSILLLYPSSTDFLRSFTKLVSILFSQVPFICRYTFILFIYFPRLYTLVTISRSVSLRFCRRV